MKKLIALSLLACCLASCGSPIKDRGLHEDALDLAKRYVEQQGGDVAMAKMSTALNDLNGDYLDDVFVHIWDEATVCSGQGCTMLVFENRGNHLKLRSDIRNVHVRLDTRSPEASANGSAGKSNWATLVVASKDALGKDHIGGEPVTIYELAFEPKSKRGYPDDATQGKLQTW